jgi:hypothetical protein
MACSSGEKITVKIREFSVIILGNKTSESQLFNGIPESDDEPHAG